MLRKLLKNKKKEFDRMKAEAEGLVMDGAETEDKSEKSLYDLEKVEGFDADLDKQG